MEEQKIRSRMSHKLKWIAGQGPGWVIRAGDNEESTMLDAEKGLEAELAKRDFIYDEYTVATNVASYHARNRISQTTVW